MFEIVREVDGDLPLESIDDQWLRIKTGASNFRLACLSSKEFPAWPGMEDMEEISLEAKPSWEAIEKTVFAAGDSDTRYTLNGLLFHIIRTTNFRWSAQTGTGWQSGQGKTDR